MRSRAKGRALHDRLVTAALEKGISWLEASTVERAALVSPAGEVARRHYTGSRVTFGAKDRGSPLRGVCLGEKRRL